MKKSKRMLVALLLVSLPALVLAQQVSRSLAPENAQVYIVSPLHGAAVEPTFTVVFGLRGMGIAPAGVPLENTGHHHLLINGEDIVDLDLPLGADVTHFGAGQTETTLKLPVGEHTLQLVLGDHMHRPHNPPVMSEKITIRVRPVISEKMKATVIR